MNVFITIILVIIISVASCRDFYVEMFKKNDLLVAQDRLYKERVPFKYMYAKYGRIFKCKITYFRVSDRLGYGTSPKVQIVRGGLNHKYLVLRLTSAYNKPIYVNIYVGCANTFTTAKIETRASEINNQDITTKQTGDQKTDAVTAAAAESTGGGAGGGGVGGDSDGQTTTGSSTAAATTVAPTTA